MRRPTILIDMDGPLADFDRHYWTNANALGRDTRTDIYENAFDIPNLSEQSCRFLSDHVTNEKIKKAARRDVDSPGWFEELPLVKGAKEGINTLAEVADVWVCSKPLEANPTCRDEKAAWLNEHIGEGWDKRLILTADKSMVRGDLLLDDAIKPEWVPFAEWQPVVFEAPFNRVGTKHGQDWARFTWDDGIENLLELTR